MDGHQKQKATQAGEGLDGLFRRLMQVMRLICLAYGLIFNGIQMVHICLAGNQESQLQGLAMLL